VKVDEPERNCARCGRRLVVQVFPDHVESRCVRCGPATSPPKEASPGPSAAR
jgi:ribosomal protein S27AE